VLCMSLRTTTPIIAREIIDAWLGTTEVDPEEAEQIARVERT
jgi:ribose 5-phosphate isomerase RpiB